MSFRELFKGQYWIDGWMLCTYSGNDPFLHWVAPIFPANDCVFRAAQPGRKFGLS